MLKYLLGYLFLCTSLWAQPMQFTTKVFQEAGQALIHTKSKSKIQVNINPNVLQKNHSVLIHLPDELTATFLNDKLIYRKEGDFTWSGKSIDGNKRDSILLTTKDGATYGVIVSNNIRYVVQKSRDGMYNVFRKSMAEIETHDFIKLPPQKHIELQPMGLNESYPSPTSNEQAIVFETVHTSSELNVNSIVDVMILYTQQYADHYGSGLNAKIQFSIDYANIAMSNSNVLLTFNLAHQDLYENNSSNETAGLSSALSHIRDSDEIKQLRATYNIDVTSLFHLDLDGGTVGLGYIPNDASRSSMRRASYNVSSFSDDVFVHETGHNLGCGHDWDLDNCSGGLFSYSCGFNSNNLGTIMSYNANKIQYFSNPDIFINPVYIGVAEGASNAADCSRSINETRGIMAMNNDITESNESGDSLTENAKNEYIINGNINTHDDRDSYLISLGAETTIQMSSIYNNIAFYANLYTENGYLIRSFITASETVTLDNGQYILVISNEDDVSGTYYSNSYLSYTINLNTHYSEKSTLAPAIYYLLD